MVFLYWLENNMGLVLLAYHGFAVLLGAIVTAVLLWGKL